MTFNVVGLHEDAGDSFGVMVNGKLTKLTTTMETYPLWSANVAGVNAPLTYKYVHLEKNGKVNKQEKVERKLPQGAIHTPNEFFDRSHSLHNLPPLPQVFENKLEQNSPFFREGFIGNMFVEGDPAKIKFLNKGGAEFHPEPIKVSVQYIGYVFLWNTLRYSIRANNKSEKYSIYPTRHPFLIDTLSVIFSPFPQC